MSLTLGLGYSSCPNDTFMFHALVSGRVSSQQLAYSVYMADIEALNARCVGDTDLPPLAVSKVSAGALPWLTESYTALGAGAALGRGCGPLVVVRSDAQLQSIDDLAGKRVGIPGERTTANLLLRVFGPPSMKRQELRFDEIMPAVERGELDAGLIIHESRFTYPEHGLRSVADLGELWEGDTGLPLPLGVIVARRELREHQIAEVERGISASVRHAYAKPEDSQPYIREHAQEMSEQVCKDHIALYVNEFSIDIGDEGRRAVDTLLARGAKAGALPADIASPWR